MDHRGIAHLFRALARYKVQTGCIVAFSLLFAACGQTPSPTSSAANSGGSTFGPSAATISAPATKPALSLGHDAVISSNGTSGFVLLGNAAVTATNAAITGDVGTFEPAPTGAVVLTNSQLTGSIHVGDAVAVQAYNDFLSTYDAIGALACEGVPLTGTLDGVTLAPGIYCFDAAATLTGTLTLDGPANGVWIFKIGTLAPGALTGTSFEVVTAGGAQACNVTWWVDAAVTMTDSDFLGNILAGAAVTVTGGTLNGNAWSKAGVTVTGPATVVGCESSMGNGNGNHHGNHHGKDKDHYNQGVGNGPDGGDPGNSNHKHASNDEDGGTPGNPGRKGSQ